MQSDSEPSVKAIVCNCHKNFIEVCLFIIDVAIIAILDIEKNFETIS